MTRRVSDPLAEVEWLLVDGSNVLHALARRADPTMPGGPGGGDRGASAPGAAIVGRLRALVPPEVAITVVFDGPPDRGLGTRRLAGGVDVRWGGRTDADSLLRTLAAEAPRASLVVTDDAELARGIRHLGSRTVGTRWLVERLGRQRLSSPAVGRRRPPTGAGSSPGRPAGANRPVDEETGTRWRPGRGATRKTGNPRKLPRRERPTGGSG